VEPEIRPEPEDAERLAILAALAEEPPTDPWRSAWRATGIRESTNPSCEE
jgi:hypothetical protein